MATVLDPKLSWYTTAMQALRGADLSGQTAIVTGGNSGIGVETVRALAHAGARVILTSRSVAAGAAVVKGMEGLKGAVVVRQLDLADLQNVVAFAKGFLASEAGPHLLILNAGIMATPLGYSKDGYEMQMATNHFGGFVLTQALLPSMKALDAPARIVVVSSRAHELGDTALDLDDLHYRQRPYNAFGAYGQSKLANVLFAKELARRLEGTQIMAFSLHPGVIMTNLMRHLWLANTQIGGTIASVLFWPWLKTPERGAATTITAAVAPELKGHSGAYLHDSAIMPPSPKGRDPDLARRLWDVTAAQVTDPSLADGRSWG